ncbi:MAG: heavy metal-binding domain-containing protein [Desulfobulbaceae bacterium]|nr:heavy metal-binding domain-containing protein [Desulfobulbaceae bacterium]
MLISNTPEIFGYRITGSIGLVTGNMVQSKHIGRDIMAGLKTIIGGEVAGYTEMLVEAREEAINRMVAQAENKGANAIVNVRFTTSAIAAGMSELLVYGTAVVVEKIN